MASSNGNVPSSDEAFHNGEQGPLLEYENSLARLSGDKELFDEFVEIFFNDSPDMLSRLSKAVEQDQAADLAQAAHAIKGLTSNFGAKPFCELALEFELAGKNGKAKSMSKSLSKLQDLYDQVCCELKDALS